MGVCLLEPPIARNSRRRPSSLCVCSLRGWHIVFSADFGRQERERNRFFVYNLCSGRRVLLGTLQKSLLCKCGCKGYDTTFGVLNFLEYCLSAAAHGYRPGLRWDGSEFAPDSKLLELYTAKPRTGARYIVTQIKGDWVEFSSTFSFASFATHHAPCLFCRATKPTLCNFRNLTSTGHTWGTLDDGWYDRECVASEIVVDVVTETDRQIILSAPLGFDKGKKKDGHVIMADCPHFKLLKGDRLEPSRVLPDTVDFPTAALPLRVVFWRRKFDHKNRPLNRVLHRNPLFSPTTGLSPDNVHIDLLHTAHLGVYLSLIQEVCWSAVRNDIYGIGGAKEHVLEISVRRLLADMKMYYARERVESGCQINRLTAKMLGSWSLPDFKVKAGEASALIGWAADFSARWQGVLPNGGALAEAASILVQWKSLISSAGPVFSRADYERAVQMCLRHCVLMEFLGAKLLPKHHLWAHLNLRIEACGGPRCYSCFLDESLNAMLGAVCQASHKLSFEQSVFDRFRLLPFTARGRWFANL